MNICTVGVGTTRIASWRHFNFSKSGVVSACVRNSNQVVKELIQDFKQNTYIMSAVDISQPVFVDHWVCKWVVHRDI